MKAIVLLASALFGLSLAAAADVSVASPEGRVQFVLSTNAQGQLQYTVKFQSKSMIDASNLGIVVDGADLADGVQIGAAETYKVDETYPWRGAHSTAINKCNEVKIALTHPKTKTAYTLEVRAYDYGIAFRNLVPGQGDRTPDEATEFRVPAGAIIAPQNYVSGYEGLYPWRTTASRRAWRRLPRHAAARHQRTGGPESRAPDPLRKRHALSRSAVRRRVCRHADEVTSIRAHRP